MMRVPEESAQEQYAVCAATRRAVLPLGRGLVCVCLLTLLALAGCSKNSGVHADLAPEVTAEAVSVTPDNSGPADTAGSRAAGADDALFEDYDDEESEHIADPLEKWNRFWFGFNDIVLMHLVKPVYTGYTRVVPQEFRSGLSNFFHNAQMPVRFLNNVLQGKFPQAIVELGRFIVNTTVGFGGFFDITRRNKVLVPMDPEGASFSQTLAHWGVGEGIYLVWPVFGPSTIRDTLGLAGDWAASPFWWAVEPVGPVEFWPGLAAAVGLRFNDFGSTLDAYEAVTKGAVEPYVAARDAYVKYRRALFKRAAQMR